MGNQRDAHAFPVSRHLHHRGNFHAVGALALPLAQRVRAHSRLFPLHALSAFRKTLVDAHAQQIIYKIIIPGKPPASGDFKIRFHFKKTIRLLWAKLPMVRRTR